MDSAKTVLKLLFVTVAGGPVLGYVDSLAWRVAALLVITNVLTAITCAELWWRLRKNEKEPNTGVAFG
jgi:hypothetical protein